MLSGYQQDKQLTGYKQGSGGFIKNVNVGLGGAEDQNKKIFNLLICNMELIEYFLNFINIKNNIELLRNTSPASHTANMGNGASANQSMSLIDINGEGAPNAAINSIAKDFWKYVKGKRYVENLGLRKYLYSYNHMNETGKYQSILYNFIKNTNRINTLDSMDNTGSLLTNNVSVLLKYFFKLIGGALISKPIFIYKNNKIIIRLFVYIKKNIFFINQEQKNNLFYLLSKNTKSISPQIISKFILKKKWFKLNKLTAYMGSLLPFNAFGEIFSQNILSVYKKEFNALTKILEIFFNNPIQLEITRIHYPFFDSNILAQIIGLNGKFLSFERIVRQILSKIVIRNPKTSRYAVDLSPNNKNSVSSYISGLKIKVAGRFYRQAIVPRKTVSLIQKGTLSRGVVNFNEFSRYLNKSKRGSFCLSVNISHIF
jgi:hypothetical protein